MRYESTLDSFRLQHEALADGICDNWIRREIANIEGGSNYAMG